MHGLRANQNHPDDNPYWNNWVQRHFVLGRCQLVDDTRRNLDRRCFHKCFYGWNGIRWCWNRFHSNFRDEHLHQDGKNQCCKILRLSRHQTGLSQRCRDRFDTRSDPLWPLPHAALVRHRAWREIRIRPNGRRCNSLHCCVHLNRCRDKIYIGSGLHWPRCHERDENQEDGPVRSGGRQGSRWSRPLPVIPEAGASM